jgi:hypothetical protein
VTAGRRPRSATRPAAATAPLQQPPRPPLPPHTLDHCPSQTEQPSEYPSVAHAVTCLPDMAASVNQNPATARQTRRTLVAAPPAPPSVPILHRAPRASGAAS